MRPLKVYLLPERPEHAILFTDYEETKPVKQCIGSIDDITLLREACQDVSCVMHIAGIVDVSLFPDDKKLMRVNVQGN